MAYPSEERVNRRGIPLDLQVHMKSFGSGSYQPERSPILILRHGTWNMDYITLAGEARRLRNTALAKVARESQAVQDQHGPTVHMEVS